MAQPPTLRVVDPRLLRVPVRIVAIESDNMLIVRTLEPSAYAPERILMTMNLDGLEFIKTVALETQEQKDIVKQEHIDVRVRAGW